MSSGGSLRGSSRPDRHQNTTTRKDTTMNMLTILRKRDAVDREATLLQQKADLQRRLAHAHGVLLNLVEDVECIPTAIHIPPRAGTTVKVPKPPQLQVTLHRAKTLLGGDHSHG